MEDEEEKPPVSQEHLDELVDEFIHKMIGNSLPDLHGQDYDIACRVYRAFLGKDRIEHWALVRKGLAEQKKLDRYFTVKRHGQVIKYIPDMFSKPKTKSYYRVPAENK